MPVSGTAVENRRGSGRWMRNGEQSERGRGKEDGGRPSSGSVDDRAVPTHYCTTRQIRVITNNYSLPEQTANLLVGCA